MADKIVKEWLAEYKGLSEAEIYTFASTIRQNDELIHSIFIILEDRYNHIEIIEPIFHQLFSFYRSRESELQRFTLQYIPTLIWLYLSAISRKEKKSCGSIEALLLGIYNLEIVNSDGSFKVQTFRVPSLTQPSIFHEPMSTLSLALTEHALNRHHLGDSEVVTIGPYPQVESFTAQNRLNVLSYLIKVYNSDIASMSIESLQAMCRMCSRLTTTGFNDLHKPPLPSNNPHLSHNNSSDSLHSLPHESRIPLNSQLLIESTHAIYYIMFNGLGTQGMKAIENIHTRASYELYTDVLLMTNAIQNSLKVNPSGQPCDGPMGISIALSPTTSTTTVSKGVITNASFRAKKLPDDIPIPVTGENAEKNLPAISEESEEGEKGKVESEKSSKQGSTKSASKSKGILSKSEKGKSSKKELEAQLSAPAIIQNGDYCDDVKLEVSVIKNQNWTIVDSIEMRGLNKSEGKKPPNKLDLASNKGETFIPDLKLSVGNFNEDSLISPGDKKLLKRDLDVSYTKQSEV